MFIFNIGRYLHVVDDHVEIYMKSEKRHLAALYWSLVYKKHNKQL